MATWYRAFSDDVRPVEVERFTEKCVWIKGRQERRESWQSFFQTPEEAWDWLIAQKQDKVDLAKTTLMFREADLEKLKIKRAASASAPK